MRQETFDNQKAADEYGKLVDRVGGAAAQQVLRSREARENASPTLREYTARYLNPETGLLTGIEPGTRAGYEKASQRSFLKILGDYPVDAIQKQDVGKWVEWQERQPSVNRPGKTVAAKTVRNYHALLSSVLASAVEEGIRKDNPAYKTRLTKGTKREGVFLTPDEFSTLLYFIPDRYEAFVLFLAHTGCRWGEATAVTWDDLNLRSVPPTVRIDEAWKKGPTGAPVLKQPKSVKSRRTVSFDAELAHAIEALPRTSNLVFPGPRSGGHLWYGRFRDSTWLPAVRKSQDRELCEAAGLEPITKTPTVHDLRHSHASWLIADGIPLAYVQARLGHESINTTVGVYGHLQPDAHTQMAAAIGRTLSGSRHLRAISG